MRTAPLPLSQHAGERMQQRRISPPYVDLLLTYGTRTRGSGGAEFVFFDGRARRALERDVGSRVMARLSDLIGDICAIVGHDGSVITVARRLRRIERDWRRRRSRRSRTNR